MIAVSRIFNTAPVKFINPLQEKVYKDACGSENSL